MKTSALVSILAAALCVVGSAAANNGKVRYSFLGTVAATPNNGGVSINVDGGNKQALRKMLGAPITQTFAFGSSTEFLKWSAGIPTIVQPTALAAGDYVWVHVRAPRNADLATIEQTGASLVGDHGTQLYKPTKPLYLYRGKLLATGAGTVTVQVTGGNHRALRHLIGAGNTQTFSVGDSTIYLLWQGKVPTVIDQSKLTIGDNVTVRFRGTGAPAVKVAEHEPANVH
jgi:hypothetical protein